MPMLVCNIGWMDFYRGQTSRDRIKGNFDYLKEHGIGHEVCNFLPDGDEQYGYVQALHQIKLEKLGTSPLAPNIDGITVIWTATRPGGKTVVVGWYENATIYRRFEPLPVVSAPRKTHGITNFNVWAKASDTRLLPVDERTIEVPRGLGGMGQSPVWFAASPEAASFREAIRRLLSTGERPAKPKPKRTQDVDRKQAVERAAVAHVRAYYERANFEVASVEGDNVGWDLVARNRKVKLQIEVKGLSGTSRVIELTPNEYKAWQGASLDYRLAVVTDALGSPNLSICRYSIEHGGWVVDVGVGTVEIKERPGARISIL